MRGFGGDLGIDSEAPDAQQQWDRFLEQEANILRVLRRSRFWDYLWIVSGTPVTIDIEAGSPALRTALQNPFALPLLLADIWSASSANLLFTLGRAMAVAHPTGNTPDAAIQSWLLRHPLDLYATAFAWDHHAAAFSAHNPRLAGPHGALMLAHAAFAALMTGLSLDTPTWLTLLATRDTQDPCIVFGHALYQLCSLHDREDNARIVQTMLAAPPEPLRAILDPFASG